jgi:hypothetical protein
MYIEQKLATCRACGRSFALQYDYCDELPSHVTDVTTVVTVTCPHDKCRRKQQLTLLFRVRNVAVKWLPLLDVAHATSR